MNCRTHSTEGRPANFACSSCSEPLCFYCVVKLRGKLYCAGCRDQAASVPPRVARRRERAPRDHTIPAAVALQLFMWMLVALYLGRNLIA